MASFHRNTLDTLLFARIYERLVLASHSNGIQSIPTEIPSKTNKIAKQV